MMKKCISLLLILILCCPCFAFAEETQQQNTAANDAVKMLKSLEIADIDESRFGSVITRGEFCSFARSISNLRQINAKTDIYTDVTADYEFSGAVNALSAAGIIGGFEDGSFKPEQSITAMEALVVLVRLMGYGINAETGGGYPAGYFMQAKSIGLLKNITLQRDGFLTVDSAVILMDNALKGYVQKQVEFGEDIKYSAEDKITLMYDAFKITMLTGIVDGVDLTSLRGANTVKPYRMTLNGFEIDMGYETVYPYLGYSVNAYCTDDSGDYVLKYIEKTNKNREYSEKLSNVRELGAGKMRAVNDEKTKSYSYEKTAAVIYNGVSTMSALCMELIDGKDGEIRLLDNNGDGVAEVVFIDAYEDYVVVDKNKKDSVIYDYYTVGKSIDLDTKEDDPYVVIYDGEGKETNVYAIKPFTSAVVYSSLPDAYQQYRKVYLSNETVSGNVDEIQENEDGVCAVIDGAGYELTNTCYNKSKELLKPGSSVELLLNIYKKAVYVKKAEKGGMGFAYLINAACDGVIGSQLQYKIFTAEGSFAVLNSADNLKIDGKTYKQGDSDKVLDALYEASVLMYPEMPSGRCSQLIAYKLNSEGKIVTIDTVAQTAKTAESAAVAGDYSTSAGDNALYWTTLDSQPFNGNAYSFQGKVMLKRDTVVISHPSPIGENYNDEELYLVRKAGDCFKNDLNYSVKAFYDKKRTAMPSILTYEEEKKPSVNYYTDVAIFVKSTDSVDGDGILSPKITFVQAGTTTDMLCESGLTYTGGGVTAELTKLKCGDVFLFSANNRNKICNFELLYSTADDKVVKDYSANAFKSNLRVNKAYVIGKYDDGLKVAFVDTRDALKSALPADKVEFITRGGAVIRYDRDAVRDSSRLKVEDFDSIKAAEDVGADLCSHVLVHQIYGNSRTIYIFE